MDWNFFTLTSYDPNGLSVFIAAPAVSPGAPTRVAAPSYPLLVTVIVGRVCVAAPIDPVWTRKGLKLRGLL